jgi:hypothetical protein
MVGSGDHQDGEILRFGPAQHVRQGHGGITFSVDDEGLGRDGPHREMAHRRGHQNQTLAGQGAGHFRHDEGAKGKAAQQQRDASGFLRGQRMERLHSRKLRSFDEVAFQ